MCGSQQLFSYLCLSDASVSKQVRVSPWFFLTKHFCVQTYKHSWITAVQAADNCDSTSRQYSCECLSNVHILIWEYCRFSLVIPGWNQDLVWLTWISGAWNWGNIIRHYMVGRLAESHFYMSGRSTESAVSDHLGHVCWNSGHAREFLIRKCS